jgi:AAA+ superfamily predicted ATPase
MTSNNPVQLEGPLPQRRDIPDFVVRRKDRQNGASALIKEVEPFLLSEETHPSDFWQERYASLVGLKDIKAKVLTALRSLFSPEYVRHWSQEHNCETQAFALLRERYPVFLFDGVPGVGKTELAHAIGDPLARVLGCQVVSYSIGLQLRGEGLVGQLSQNIAKLIAFGRLRHAERGLPILLVLNEGDAIGQSRDDPTQHHEESVGVSTLLQQIDLLRGTPGVALIMTSNRHSALDSALASRISAHRVRFPQPDYGLRFYLLKRYLDTIIATRDLQALAKATEGFSPRDIVELLQAAFLEAMTTECPVTMRLLVRAAAAMGKPLPTGCQKNHRALERAWKECHLLPMGEMVHGNGHIAQQAV